MSSTVELVSDRAPSVDLTVYRKEIYNFLKTVTIKYSPLVDGMNEHVLRRGGTVIDGQPQTWKYYKNAIGEYHEIDTPMYISSLDNKQKILFSKDALKTSPRTLEAYSVGSDFYNELCSLYPGQVDLIKGIRYPVSNWEDLYHAPDLTYINGDESIFEENERDSLIAQLNRTLKFIDARWNFPGTGVEPLYPWSFWGYIWQILATALFAQRFENIRSPDVHSWNVWQYITSQGLSDYSDLLTFSQSMFLYRNLNYLNLNRGKQSNLIILADNLLTEWSLSLYGRSVIQRTDIGANNCLLYPDLVAKVIPTQNASDVPIPKVSVEDMIYKLIAVGDEIPANEYPPEENAQRQERLLSDTSVNTYPTKVVEIAPVDRNKKYTAQFDTYIYDSLIYGIASGDYNPIVEIPSRVSQEVIQLTAKECLLLFNYCMIRALGDTPTKIPTVHKSALAIKPTYNTIQQWYNIENVKTNVNAYVNLNDYTNNNFQMDYQQSDPTSFSNELLKGFETLIHQISLQRLNADVRVGRIMRLISKNMLIIGDVPLNLTDAQSYDEWLGQHQDLVTQVLAPIEASKKTAQGEYEDLAANIVDTLVPIIPGFNTYGDFQITDSSYQRIKQLFIQLTSYNITFVDDNTSSPSYLFSPQFFSSIWDESTTGDTFYDQFQGIISITDYIADKIPSAVFDNVISIEKDVLTEPSFGSMDLTPSGSKISHDVYTETRYVSTGYHMTLSLPDAPTPLSSQ